MVTGAEWLCIFNMQNLLLLFITLEYIPLFLSVISLMWIVFMLVVSLFEG